MFRKIFFAFIFTLGLLFLYQNKLLAIEGLDIVLQDDTEQKTVTVLVDSKDSNVAGIDMIILFSDDIIIEEITESEDYCRMLFNAFDEDNRLMKQRIL